MSIDQIKFLMASAAAAFGARDYATARDDAGHALGLLGAVPDGEKEGVSMEWDRRSIPIFWTWSTAWSSEGPTSSERQTTTVSRK